MAVRIVFLVMVSFFLEVGEIYAQTWYRWVDGVEGKYSKIMVDNFSALEDDGSAESYFVADMSADSTEKVAFRNNYSQFFDNEGNLVEVIEYDIHNRPQSRMVYEYDNAHNLIGGVKFGSKGSVVSKYKFVNNKAQKIIEEMVYNDKGKLSGKVFYYFDENGNVDNIKTFSANGNLIKKFTYRYDDNRMRSDETITDKDGNIVREVNYDYLFDSRGNWVRRVARNPENKMMGITYRTIE